MLHNFTHALETHKEQLDYHQYWRWTKAGALPQLITWLAERPELVEALAKDARELSRHKQGSVEALPEG